MGRQRKPIEHGTNKGAAAHRYRNEPPCDACRQAKIEYNTEWQRKSGYNAADHAALRRLQALHPEEFQTLLAEERAKRNYPAGN